MTDPRLEAADLAYQRAVFAGDSGAIASAEAGLDAVEADLALARGRLLHARHLDDGGGEDPHELELFQRAGELYADLSDARGQGEALFWAGIVHQVIRGDQDAAVLLFERSLALAADAGDDLTRSYALRHLGIAASVAGDMDTARAQLEESTRLRTALGFDAGAAANLIGLAHIAASEDRADDVGSILAEAMKLTAGPDAAGVRTWVEQARADLQAFL